MSIRVWPAERVLLSDATVAAAPPAASAYEVADSYARARSFDLRTPPIRTRSPASPSMLFTPVSRVLAGLHYAKQEIVTRPLVRTLSLILIKI